MVKKVVVLTKKRKRNKRRRQSPLDGRQPALVAVRPAFGRQAKARRRVPRVNGTPLTPGGQQFLKCALAPVDFPGLRAGGVPDLYSGPSMTMRHKSLSTHQPTSAAAEVTYFAFLPMPGIAYWKATSATGLTTGLTWVPEYFPDFTTLFGDPTVSASNFGTINVDRFRYVSLNVEIKSIGAPLNSAGLITAARAPGVELTTRVNNTQQQEQGLGGLSSLSVASLFSLPGVYTGPVVDGAYGWSLNESGNWAFSDIFYNTAGLLSADDAVTTFVGKIMGWGNMTPIIVNFSASGASTKIMITTECCIEYAPRAGSMLAGMAAPSPPHDEMALELYAKAGKELPAFVMASRNDGFWEKFLGIVSSVAGAIAPFFGPVGAGISGGISAVTGGIRSLIM